MNRATKGLLIVHDGVEKTITIVLLLVLMVVVVWATAVYSIELLGLLGQRMGSGEPIDQVALLSFIARFRILHEVFSGFLLILIGVELMKTIAIYLTSHEMHVEVVFTVAIIAIARHAIDLNLQHLDPMQVVGLAILLLALAVGHFLFRKALTIRVADEGSRS